MTLFTVPERRFDLDQDCSRRRLPNWQVMPGLVVRAVLALQGMFVGRAGILLFHLCSKYDRHVCSNYLDRNSNLFRCVWQDLCTCAKYRDRTCFHKFRRVMPSSCSVPHRSESKRNNKSFSSKAIHKPTCIATSVARILASNAYTLCIAASCIAMRSLYIPIPVALFIRRLFNVFSSITISNQYLLAKKSEAVSSGCEESSGGEPSDTCHVGSVRSEVLLSSGVHAPGPLSPRDLNYDNNSRAQLACALGPIKTMAMERFKGAICASSDPHHCDR